MCGPPGEKPDYHRSTSNLAKQLVLSIGKIAKMQTAKNNWGTHESLGPALKALSDMPYLSVLRHLNYKICA